MLTAGVFLAVVATPRRVDRSGLVQCACMLQRITGSLAYLRPRSLARTRKAVDDLVADTRELRQAVRALRDQHSGNGHRESDALRAQLGAIHNDLTEIRALLTTLTEQQSQLRAIAEADAALDPHQRHLPSILNQEWIAAHLRTSIQAAELRLDPFPHASVENLFPEKFYDALVRGIPPVELFGGRVNKRQVVVPFTMGPVYGRRVWRFMARQVAEDIAEVVTAKFREPLAEWIAANWPELAADPLGPPVNMHSSDGRIMLRGRGYNIPPHRDPKWGFITCLIYLVRPGDLETWGTALYRVDDDQEAVGGAPHWIKREQCHLVTEVPFRANSALIFLNSTGAHGASIPEDAEPADLQRYAYQFRIGPNRPAIAALKALLPEERQQAWAGKVTDY